MGQLYMQRFEYRGAISKSEYDAAWAVANDVMGKTGNWGSVKSGVKHLRAFLTGWGGYALIEVEDPKAFAEYQQFHVQNYSHLVTISFDPVVDLEAASK
jgi:hypothetical protein